MSVIRNNFNVLVLLSATEVRPQNEDLNMEEDKNKTYKSARQMERDKKDASRKSFIRDRDGNYMVERMETWFS